MVKVSKEKIENGQAYLSLELEPAEIEDALEKTYHRLVKKTRIPGFRKGKAPRVVLERYLGKESVLEEAINELLPDVYEQAIKEQELEAMAQPHIEIIQTDPVVIKATVPLRPVVKLGDYRNIQVASQPVELNEDDGNAVIEQLRHQHATWQPVERPVDFGDLVVLDVDGNVDSTPFINQKGAQYQVMRDSSFPAPGFAEQLAGMKTGEDKEFKLQFPADYPRTEVAGKESSFKVKVTEIKQENLPELDSKFAKLVDPDIKTLNALRKRVSADLRARAEEKARIDFEEQAIEAAVDISEVEFPPILVEMETDRLLSEQSQRLQMMGSGLEQYLQSVSKTEESLRDELHPVAAKRVTRSLVLGKIAEEEKIEVTAAEIDAEIESMMGNTAENKKDELQRYLNTPRARESIEQSLVMQRTIARLVEIAKGDSGEVSLSGKKRKAKK